MVEEQSMIFIMGLSGSGKSRFVNLLQRDSVREGAGLESETQECQIVQLCLGNKLVSVVDTPGFGDSQRTDAEILAIISDFLILQHTAGFKLCGVIWLHGIEQQRMRLSDEQALIMFQDICGKEGLSSVTLLTTKWDTLHDERTGAMRERTLRRKYWKDMVNSGATAQRFDGSQGMAKAIIRRIMRNDGVVLQIQKDSMEKGKRLRDTAAGVRIVQELEGHLRQQEDKVRKMEWELRSVGDASNHTATQALQQRYEAETREQERLRSTCRRMNADLGEEMVEKWGEALMAAQPDRMSDSETDAKPEAASQDAKSETKKRTGPDGKWKGRISAFASVLGLTLNAVVHIILPLAGVAI
ncbi:hypothetical protein QBC40DRAFT_88013 [Triangularia verruculosa]|uniref:AIG1-type G domain-containing protein n=1 Tax=Triangularia verruculosa TaxID=2587418 RepID=A0AAN7ATX3_9PEZI|nr:hypothetical protein QBC40DRAFT_88013 [Triangularia verruculosa]